MKKIALCAACAALLSACAVQAPQQTAEKKQPSKFSVETVIQGDAGDCDRNVWITYESGDRQARFLAFSQSTHHEQWSGWQGCGSYKKTEGAWTYDGGRAAGFSTGEPSFQGDEKSLAGQFAKKAAARKAPSFEDIARSAAELAAGDAPEGRYCLNAPQRVQAYGYLAHALPFKHKGWPGCQAAQSDKDEKASAAPAGADKAQNSPDKSSAKVAIALTEACLRLAEQGKENFGPFLECKGFAPAKASR